MRTSGDSGPPGVERRKEYQALKVMLGTEMTRIRNWVLTLALCGTIGFSLAVWLLWQAATAELNIMEDRQLALKERLGSTAERQNMVEEGINAMTALVRAAVDERLQLSAEARSRLKAMENRIRGIEDDHLGLRVDVEAHEKEGH